MTSKHTPGPWKASRNNAYWEIRIDHEGKFDRQLGDLCATGCEPGHDSGEEEANARLCAAAPELLEALEEVIRVFDSGDPAICDTVWTTNKVDSETLYDHCRAAIAKARGTASV